MAHTPEARSAGRAETAQIRIAENLKAWYGTIDPKPADGAENEAEKAESYSRWRLALHKIMKAATEAIETLTAKRAALRIVRAERAAERLAAVRDAERREKAEVAVADVERLILENESAADAFQDARDDEMRTRFHEEWPTPKEMAHEVLIDAISERAEAEYQLRKSEKKLRPADDLPDPKTGGWTKAKEMHRSAQKKLNFSIRHEALMQARHKRTPTHDEAVATLAAAEARVGVAKEDLAVAKKAQEALLAPGRPVTAVSKVAA